MKLHLPACVSLHNTLVESTPGTLILTIIDKMTTMKSIIISSFIFDCPEGLRNLI